MATEAFISGRLLRWARERDGVTPEAAAKRVNVTADRLQAWEDEQARPTLNQAQKLAQGFNVPFGYLYLSSPPAETLPLPDLRTISNSGVAEPSPDLLAVVNDALAKQDWYRSVLEESGAEPLDFVGAFSARSGPDAVANAIAQSFGVDDEMRHRANSWEAFLTLFVRACEAKGVLVLRNGVVGNNTSRTLNPDEFRGFAISDDLAPLVFINARDAKAAQIFTLAHELAHLLIGESGVSNPDYRSTSAQQGNQTEALCNSIAAELLVPAKGFEADWDDRANIASNVQSLARRYRVSRFVVLRRAYDLNKMNQETYWRYYNEFFDDEHRPEGSGGGDFYTNLFARTSRLLASAVIDALSNGTLTHRDAASLMNVKRISTLDGVAAHLS